MSRTNRGIGRRHVRHACEACKSSKRKCDGQQPCSMCMRYEFDCEYKPQQRRRQAPVSRIPDQSSAASSILPSIVSPLAEDAAGEATSGVSFLAGFASRTGTDCADDPQPLAWNLGLRDSSIAPLDAIIVSPQQARSLSAVYFEKVHSLYDFIDRPAFNKYLESDTWCEDSQVAILYGTLAIGSFFENSVNNHSTLEPVLENALVERAHIILESYNVQGNVSLNNIAGWILQVIYCRLTRRALSAWLASCTTMHLIQALGLHTEAKWPRYLQMADTSTQETFKKQFWTAYLLHSWISFELGKPRIEFANTCSVPQRTQSGFKEKLDMYQLSTLLDGQSSHLECEAWVSAFENAYSLVPSHDELIFDQTMLCLIFYRHIRLCNPKLAEQYNGKMISVGTKGLSAAMSLIQKREPWWHVASVPFQLLCIFLLMDCHESFSIIPQALKVITTTATSFPSMETQRSEQTAMTLLRMVQRRKEADAEALRLVLTPYGSPLTEQMFLDPTPNIDYGDLDWIWNELLSSDQSTRS